MESVTSHPSSINGLPFMWIVPKSLPSREIIVSFGAAVTLSFQVSVKQHARLKHWVKNNEFDSSYQQRWARAMMPQSLLFSSFIL